MSIDRAAKTEPDVDFVPKELLVKDMLHHAKQDDIRCLRPLADWHVDSNASAWDQLLIGGGSVDLYGPPQSAFRTGWSDGPTSKRLNHKRVLTGPILLLRKILTTWRLGEGQATRLLGLDPSDESYVTGVLGGCQSLKGRDVNDRLAYLIQIRMALFAWFRDETVENDWLREVHVALDHQVPMDLLLEGSMENLLLVKEYVEAATGW